MDELDALNRCLHEQAEGAVGGPLHVVTDDGNLRDSDVCYCWGDSERESDVVVRVLCLRSPRLVALTEPQRLVWWLRRRIQALGIDDMALAAAVRNGVVDAGERRLRRRGSSSAAEPSGRGSSSWRQLTIRGKK